MDLTVNILIACVCVCVRARACVYTVEFLQYGHLLDSKSSTVIQDCSWYKKWNSHSSIQGYYLASEVLAWLQAVTVVQTWRFTHVCVCVCVSIFRKERARYVEVEGVPVLHSGNQSLTLIYWKVRHKLLATVFYCHFSLYLSIVASARACVCVCVRERERETENPNE